MIRPLFLALSFLFGISLMSPSMSQACPNSSMELTLNIDPGHSLVVQVIQLKQRSEQEPKYLFQLLLSKKGPETEILGRWQERWYLNPKNLSLPTLVCENEKTENQEITTFQILNSGVQYLRVTEQGPSKQIQMVLNQPSIFAGAFEYLNFHLPRGISVTESLVIQDPLQLQSSYENGVIHPVYWNGCPYTIGASTSKLFGQETFNLYRSLRIRDITPLRLSPEHYDFLYLSKIVKPGTRSVTLIPLEQIKDFYEEYQTNRKEEEAISILKSLKRKKQ